MGMVFFNKTTPANEVATILGAAGIVPNQTFVQIICVGGGRAGMQGAFGGDSGSMDIFQGLLPTLSYDVTVGLGGNIGSGLLAQPGASSFGNLVSAEGGQGQTGSGIYGNGGALVSIGNVGNAVSAPTGTGGSTASSSGMNVGNGGGGGGFPFPLSRHRGPRNGLGLGGGGGASGSGSQGGNTPGNDGGVIVCF